MKIDAGSIFTMAAMSLLTGNVVCTEPTEMEEITKRAKEMRRIFKSKGHSVVMPRRDSHRGPFLWQERPVYA